METNTQIETKIFTITLYNLGFFGGNREGAIVIDGQYEIITNGTEFVIYKIGGYGNFISFPKVENIEPQILSESDYRYVHDSLLKQLERSVYQGEPNEMDTKLFTESKRYKIHKNRISANIGYGDKVLELDKGEVFIVDGGHDVGYINRNFNYKLVDRELHPEPETLENFIKANDVKNPFEAWTKLNEMPKKKKNWIVEHYIINGETYTAIKDYTGNGTYIIKTPNGEIFEKKSNISAPFYDAIDILTGYVKAEYENGNRFNYVYKDVIHENGDNSDFFIPNRYKKMAETKSYAYNTRLTYL